MNANIIKVGLGFALGYLTKSYTTEIKRNKGETQDLSKVIKEGKEIYNVASSYPERIPDALHSAKEELLSKKP